MFPWNIFSLFVTQFYLSHFLFITNLLVMFQTFLTLLYLPSSLSNPFLKHPNWPQVCTFQTLELTKCQSACHTLLLKSFLGYGYSLLFILGSHSIFYPTAVEYFDYCLSLRFVILQITVIELHAKHRVFLCTVILCWPRCDVFSDPLKLFPWLLFHCLYWQWLPNILIWRTRNSMPSYVLS